MLKHKTSSLNSVLSRIPLVRLIAPFILGIAMYMHVIGFVKSINIVLAFVIMVYLFVVTYKPIYTSYKFRWLAGLFAYLVMFLLGFSLCQTRTSINRANYFENVNGSYLKIQLLEPVVQKTNSLKAEVKVIEVLNNEFTTIGATVGRGLVYFENSDSLRKLNFGDQLLVPNNFKAVDEPKNPSQFNYKRYLSYNHMRTQAYFTKQQVINLGSNQGSGFKHFTYKLRASFLATLNQHITGNDEFAVASALLLGYKDDLDDKIIKAYSSTGAMHVLAVSGLHVGIIYILLHLLLSFLNRGQLRYLKAIIILVIIWFYAVLTGLSPSVFRAATMFSFITLGTLFIRHINIFNILAASAFVILWVDPYTIMAVGFQMSYLAVIGIVLLQKKLYSMWSPNNIVLDWVWKITSVSIAAQAVTFPLGMYYFHQFPTYFPISNLIVIPAASFILYLGMALFAFSSIPVLSDLIGHALNFVLKVLNQGIYFVQSFPYSLIFGIDISLLETFLIFICVFALATYFLLKTKPALIVGLSICLLIVAYNFIESIQQAKQKTITIYSINKTSGIEFAIGRNRYLIADTTLTNDESKMLFYIKHNWWKTGAKNKYFVNANQLLPEGLNIYHNHNYINFNGIKLLLIDEQFNISKVPIGEKFNYAIVKNNTQINLAKLYEKTYFDELIIDASNNYYTIKHYQAFSKELPIKLYITKDLGAKVIEL